MRPAALFTCLSASSLISASTHIAQLYYQPVTINGADRAPIPFASVEFDASSPLEASIASYDPPELADFLSTIEANDEDGNPISPSPYTSLVRIGTYDTSAKTWSSGVSVTAASTFANKGYAPHILLNVDQDGTVLGAGARGVRIDAGATRDFGPQVVVEVSGHGKGVEMGKPVILSPDGKKKVPEPEKSFLQKYWWAIGLVVFLLVGSGSDK